MAQKHTELTTRELAGGRGSQDARSGEGPSLFGLIRKNWQAHLAEGATEAELRILASQVRVIEGRREVAEAELRARMVLAEIEREAVLKDLSGRRQAAELALQAEEAEAERRLMSAVRQASPEQARRILGADLETQQLLKERDQLRRERLGTGTPLPALPAPTLLAPSVPAWSGPEGASLQVHVTDRQVETLAVRALTRFAGLPPEEADRQWDAWRRELHVRLPPYAAAEVERRADELRGLSG
jgi:hypothetical protein